MLINKAGGQEMTYKETKNEGKSDSEERRRL
jgi:hypothetical protein